MMSDPPDADRFAAQVEEHLSRLDRPQPRLARSEEQALPGPALFRAAAAYHRRAPWRVFPSDQDIVLFSVPALGVHEAVLSVMGQDGTNPGLLLFFSLGDFEAFVAAAVNDAGHFSATGNDIDKEKLPAHLALTFDAAKHVPRELRQLVSARRWDLSADDAFPAILAVEAGMRARVPKAWEQLLMEIAALGVTAFLEDESALRRAYRTDRFHDDQFELETSQGRLVAILGGPVGGEEDEGDEDGADGADGADAAGQEERDPPLSREERALAACEAVVRAFADDDEAEPFFDVSAVAAFILHASQEHGREPSAIDPELVRTILLSSYPAEAAIPPQIAPEIVAGLRSLFAWLDRTAGEQAPHAAACSAMLDEDFMRALWVELCKPALWSAEKRASMAGVRLPPVPPKSRPAGPLTQAEKNKRKAARRRG